ncbi:cell cycle negative regulator roughex [Drosophila grimshawi]|uniref:GH17896 n=1 Tax=Drosophila grimshawi TaxID=7222 RepID=B4JX75_DROGR|nr:cell cycle negative regulator roughex [Drosophila grimshawi]EDV95351.1 GH17896 [Drosophila grimshawi]
MDQPDAEPTLSASQVMRQFVQYISEDGIRRELADECILTLIGRTVKGASAVTSFLTGRYKHVGFVDAHPCDAARVSLLKDRYARSFEVLRRHQREAKPNIQLPHTLRPRAESIDDPAAADDDDDNDNNVVQSSISRVGAEIVDQVNVDVSYSEQLATPPRTRTHLHYIESVGVIEPCHQADDGGGFDQSTDALEVTLTLGYQHCSGEGSAEICLIVYKKFRPTARTTPTATGHLRTHSRMRTTLTHNVHTDDEGDVVPAPQTVRRTLFTSADSDDPDNDIAIVSLRSQTPRKRYYKSPPDVKSKRLNLGGGMRF